MRRLWPNFLIMLMFWTLTVLGFYYLDITNVQKRTLSLVYIIKIFEKMLCGMNGGGRWPIWLFWCECECEATHVQHNTKNGSLLNLFDGTEATILPSTNPFPFPPLPPSPPHPPSPAMAQVNWPLFIFQFTFTIQWTISTQYFFCCGSDFHSLSTFTFLPSPSLTLHSQPLTIAKVLQIW